MSIQMLYHTLDAIVTTICPKVAEYRMLGPGVVENRIRIMAKSPYSPEARLYLDQRKDDEAFKAYWQVQGQMSLIHVDVFGLDPHTQEAQEAVAEVGKVFQWIKVADDIVDKHNCQRVSSLDSIHELLEDKRSPKSNAEHYLVEEYATFDSMTREYLEQVFQQERVQCATKSDTIQYRERGELGRTLGEMQAKILREYLPTLPQNAENFFATVGYAGAYFDDVKDFTLDREEGHGYRNDSTRWKLILGCAYGLAKIPTTLSRRQLTREGAFIALGGLFQLREFVGLKART